MVSDSDKASDSHPPAQPVPNALERDGADNQRPGQLVVHTPEAGAASDKPSEDIAPPKRRSVSPTSRLSQSDVAPTPNQNQRANTRSPTPESIA